MVEVLAAVLALGVVVVVVVKMRIAPTATEHNPIIMMSLATVVLVVVLQSLHSNFVKDELQHFHFHLSHHGHLPWRLDELLDLRDSPD